jgi:hypothetical protein
MMGRDEVPLTAPRAPFPVGVSLGPVLPEKGGMSWLFVSPRDAHIRPAAAAGPPWPDWGYTLPEFIRTLNAWTADKAPGQRDLYTHDCTLTATRSRPTMRALVSHDKAIIRVFRGNYLL